MRRTPPGVTTVPESIWQLTSLLIAIIAVFTIVEGLFADRARGRRRCPRCWYDMAGVAALTCPECGHDARRERRLSKTRRRTPIVIAGLLLALISGVCWLMPWIERDEWTRLLPAPVLAGMIVVAGDSPDEVETKLLPRVRSTKATAWERAQVARCAGRRIQSAMEGEVIDIPLGSRPGIWDWDRFGKPSGIEACCDIIVMCADESRVADPTIRAMLRQDSPRIQLIAVDSVAGHPHRARRFVDELLDLQPANDPLAGALIAAFDSIGPPARPALGWLCRIFRDASAIRNPPIPTRARAGNAILSVVGVDQALIQQLLEDENEYVRSLAIDGLLDNRLARDRTLDILTGVMRTDPSSLVRHRIACLAADEGATPTSATQELLIIALKDDQPEIRRTAAWGLYRCGGPAAQDALVKALDRESNMHASIAILAALVRVAPADDETIHALIRQIDHESAEVAVLAIQTLVNLRAGEAMPALHNAADSDRRLVAEEATRALAAIE